VIHQSGETEEIFPLELNIDRVKRSRELGVLRLGQPLKSFRDHKVVFKIYEEGAKLPYLDSLGPLIKPTRLKKLSELRVQETLTESPSAPIDYKGDGRL